MWFGSFRMQKIIDRYRKQAKDEKANNIEAEYQMQVRNSILEYDISYLLVLLKRKLVYATKILGFIILEPYDQYLYLYMYLFMCYLYPMTRE